MTTSRPLSTRRKLALATWNKPREGNFYGKVIIDATAAIAHVEALRRATAARVTLTHLVSKAVAAAITHIPEFNGRVSFGRYIPCDAVDMAFLVAIDDGADLANVKLEAVDKLSVTELAAQLDAHSRRVRAGEDAAFESTKALLRWLPVFLIRPMLWLTGTVTARMGISLKKLSGLDRYPFGSCIITSVGAFGVDEGYSAPLPFAHVPLCVTIGAAKPTPKVVDGAVVARPTLIVTLTVDHRYADGVHGAILANYIREYAENPERLTPLEPRLEAEEVRAVG